MSIFGPPTFRRGRGFSLVEVLVSVTVLSLVLLVTLSALNGLAKAGMRLDRDVRQLEQMRLVSQFLRDSLRQAIPIQLERSPAVFFAGAPDELRWVAPLRGVDGMAGLHGKRLYLEEESLLIQFVPHQRLRDSSRREEAWGSARKHVLVDGVEHFSLAYLGEINGDWLQTWDPELGRHPAAVSLRLSAAGREWPELLVAPDMDRLWR